MDVRAEIPRYLEEVIGEPPRLRELPASAVKGLPLYLRSEYRLVGTSLLGHPFVLALGEGAEGGTPTGYATHVEMLRAAVGQDVAIVLPHVFAHVRNRLVRLGVPFVVPGRQMFLPFLAMDLRERGPRTYSGSRSVLTGAAQAVLLGHVLGMPVEGRPLRDLAVAFGYSAMALTKVAGELEAKALASVSRDGKTRRLRFGEERRALWDRAQPILASPVRVRQWVRGRGGRMPGLVAGLTALERLTEIAGDRLPTLALARRDLKGFIDRGDLVVCRFPDEAEAAVEGWSYDPARLAAGESVDALSLYLSLRETADERVRKELRRLLEGVAW